MTLGEGLFSSGTFGDPVVVEWVPGDDWPGDLEGGAASPKWGGYVRLWVRAAIAAGNTFHLGAHDYAELDAGNVMAGATPVGRTAIDRLWVDLTCDVLDVDIQGGASKGQGIFSKADAGTCTVTLLDPDGIYDPLNPIPPWQYQGRTRLLPGVPVEVFAEVIDDPSVDPATVTRYWLFTGTADSWGEDWTARPSQRTATLVASDVTKSFVRFDRPATTPIGNGDTTEERIQRIVDYYAWPGDVEAGTSTVTLDSTTHVQNAWEQLNRTLDDELGMIYITAQGNLRWTGRDVWFTLTPPALTLGCGSPDFYDVLVDASPSNLDIQMKNTVYAARTGGSTQTATSTSSIDEYGPYEYKRTDLGLADNTQVAEWATTVVELYAYPQIVLADVTMQPALHANSWDAWADVLGLKAVTDLVHVVWAPPDRPTHVVDTIVRTVGYKHTITRNLWEIEWQLVDAQSLRFTASIFTLGPHAQDQLDAGWVLGWTTLNPPVAVFGTAAIAVAVTVTADGTVTGAVSGTAAISASVTATAAGTVTGSQKLTWSTSPDNQIGGELGTRVQFEVAGTVTGVEYKDIITTTNTKTIRAWTDAGTMVVNESDSQGPTGTFVKTFATPLDVTAGEILTFTLGSSANPRGDTYALPTDAADLTFLEYRFHLTHGSAPNTSSVTRTYFITPIFQPS